MPWYYRCNLNATTENNKTPDNLFNDSKNKDEIVRLSLDDYLNKIKNFEFDGMPNIIKYILKIKKTYNLHQVDKIKGQSLLNALEEKRISCPIYFMTYMKLGLSKSLYSYKLLTEEIAYIGRTNSKNSRFKDGHRAINKLHHPKWEGEKNIYMLQVNILVEVKKIIISCNNDEEIESCLLEFPLEWVPHINQDKVLKNIETLLIKSLMPKINIQLANEGNEKDKLKRNVQKSFKLPISIINDVDLDLSEKTPFLAALKKQELNVNNLNEEQKYFSSGAEWRLLVDINS